MRDSFIARLESLAAADPRVFLITGDLGFGVLDSYVRRFPRQFLNAGVAEQNMTGLAAGLALEGRIVFTYSIANFPTLRCLEQIRNDAAYHNASVKVVAVGGGFSYGTLGFSHHATEDLAIMRSLGIPVVAPGCDWEAEEATTALVNTPGTCYLRLDRSSAGNTSRPGEEYSLGKARVVRAGGDVTLVSTGGILSVVREAAETLARTHGIESRILSVHTVSPLDRDAIVSAARDTGGLITIEEHTLLGGLGSAVAECCADAGVFPRRFHRIGIQPDAPVVVGGQGYLRTLHRMDAPSITATAAAVLSAR